MGNKIVNLSVRVDSDLRRSAHRAAIAADCTLNEYVIRVLEADPGVKREIALLGQHPKTKEKRK